MLTDTVLASVKLNDLFKDKRILYTNEKKNGPRRATKDIVSTIDDLIDSNKMSKTPKLDIRLSSYDDIVDLLKTNRNTDIIEKQIEVLPDIVQEEFVAKSNNMLSYLNSNIPLLRSEVILDENSNIAPSDYEKMKFIRIVRVADNPLHVLDLIKSGMIGHLEIESLRAMYPDILDKIQKIIVEKLVDIKSENKKISRKKMSILSILLEVPRITPQMISMYQEQFENGKIEGSEKSSKIPEATQTEVQRVSTNPI